eukprot:3923651-Rhodomonas_salina.2
MEEGIKSDCSLVSVLTFPNACDFLRGVYVDVPRHDRGLRFGVPIHWYGVQQSRQNHQYKYC